VNDNFQDNNISSVLNVTPLNVSQSSRAISRDEMNLAEFPLAVLSTRTDPKIKTLEFSDSLTGKNGESIKRNWVITGADKFGLPTASDDEVLLGLLKLSVDEGLTAQKVYFTRYELLKILKWSTEGRSYTRLQNAFDRLSGVRIKATNAFFDNETKSHSTKNFGIIDAYEINDGRESEVKPSFFIWSEELFKSFQVGFIKKLDLDFYLDLKSAVSKRLYRYLDKHFWYKVKVQINLFTLCHEKIGVSRNYKFASSLKQQLEPAILELTERGFLQSCDFVGKGDGTEVILYAARKQPRSISNREPAQKLLASQEPDPIEKFRVKINSAIEKRGINSNIAQRLTQGLDADGLARIQKILDYYDNLVSQGSPRVSKNPVGFLYRAIENPFQFSLPEDQKKTAKISTKIKNTTPDKLEAERESREFLYKEYLKIRSHEVTRLLDTVESQMLQNIRKEAMHSMQKLKGVLSNSRFEEALEHAVEEKLAKLFALPTFEEWLAEKLNSNKEFKKVKVH
jgi:hypothetical protein